jgi:type IV secretory pathway component VirB8
MFGKKSGAARLAASREPHDTGHAYRVALWTSRVLAVVAAAEALAILGLAVLITGLFPLKEVVPMFVTTGDSKDRVVKVQPFTVGMHGFDLLSETMGRRYVELRETIDLQSEVRRWQEVAQLSSPDVFNEFRAFMGRDNKNSPFERMKAERITRTVNVRAINLIYPPTPAEPSAVYQIEWESVDHRLSQEIERRVWVSSLSVQFESREVRYEDRYMNPVGYTVVGYTVAKKEG